MKLPVSGKSKSNCADPEVQGMSGIGPTNATTVTIPGNTYVSVTIASIRGNQVIPSAGGFEIGRGGRPRGITYDATNHPCTNGRLGPITINNPSGRFEWTGLNHI